MSAFSGTSNVTPLSESDERLSASVASLGMLQLVFVGVVMAFGKSKHPSYWCQL
ncbi:hypothetical protein BC832DRAFT_543387 [Gaertneriomyces semiglobifer]|nr:hypothetical protein BC832DRAFT_543387 [Gaertneriomyces semiglobifer]